MKVNENEFVITHNVCMICGKEKRGLFYSDEFGEVFLCPKCLGPIIRSSISMLYSLLEDSNEESKKDGQNSANV